MTTTQACWWREMTFLGNSTQCAIVIIKYCLLYFFEATNIIHKLCLYKIVIFKVSIISNFILEMETSVLLEIIYLDHDGEVLAVFITLFLNIRWNILVWCRRQSSVSLIIWWGAVHQINWRWIHLSSTSSVSLAIDVITLSRWEHALTAMNSNRRSNLLWILIESSFIHTSWLLNCNEFAINIFRLLIDSWNWRTSICTPLLADLEKLILFLSSLKL